MTRRIVLALVCLLVLAVLGWLIYRATRPAAPGNTATVERGRIEATVDALGSLALRRQVEVVARTGGTVQTLAVQAGERVAAREDPIRMYEEAKLRKGHPEKSQGQDDRSDRNPREDLLGQRRKLRLLGVDTLLEACQV